MMGLVEEGEEVIKDIKGSEPLDAGLIAAAQAVEHYEISRYGTLKAWAEQHGMQEVAGLLDATLAEEKRTDELLTRIAEQEANRRAEYVPAGSFPVSAREAPRGPILSAGSRPCNGASAMRG
jgi:ferritin-like metal-binding protein YciE